MPEDPLKSKFLYAIIALAYLGITASTIAGAWSVSGSLYIAISIAYAALAVGALYGMFK